MLSFIKHFFTPQVSNNYRAKILHPKILSFFILFFFASGIALSFVRHNYPQVLGTSADISINQLLILTNDQRQKVGLGALTLSEKLDQAAAQKGNDMLSNNYWAHVSPSGTAPWYFIKQAGYTYIYAGENLARGYNTAGEVVDAWMASPAHRDNVLSPNFKDVGFAVLNGKLTGEDTVLVVEMFGSPILAVENNLVQESSPSVIVSSASSVKAPPEVKPKQILSNSNVQVKPLVNAQTFSSNIALIAVTIFIFVLILDIIIIERRKILRFVGHNTDHVIFFILIIALILILLRGFVI